MTTAQAGLIVVLAGVLFNSIFLGRATVGLSLALIAAYALWFREDWGHRGKQIFPLYLACIALYIAHFIEEYLTGFYRAFPGLFGNEWSAHRFLIFNLVWLAVFALGAAGVYAERPLAYLIVAFFALGGGILNGAAHLALSLFQWRYFPGTITAPLMLAAGVLLFSRLRRDRPA